MVQTSIMTWRVKDAMTKDPITIGPKTTAEVAKTLFEKAKIHHLPVVDDKGILLGIISSSDILMLMHWATRYNQLDAIKKNEQLLNSNLAIDLITKKVIAVYQEETLYNCYEIFKQKEIRALPVINSQSKVIGIITPLDIIRLLFNEK